MFSIDPGSMPIAIILVFLLAGTVKGIMGMGMPTVAIGLMGLFLAPVDAAAILILPGFLTNVWQMLAGPALRETFRRLAGLMSGITLGTIVGVGFFAGRSSALATFALGAVLAAYALLALVSPRFTVAPRHEWWLGPLSGVFTGIISGATGIFVIPMVPYLASLGLAREALIQALGSAFTVAVLALGLCLWGFGKITSAAGTLSLIAIIPAFIGMAIGQWLRHRLSANAFRLVFLSSILALGAWMMIHASL
jgi:uncharacterized membrane protein YfcA